MMLFEQQAITRVDEWILLNKNWSPTFDEYVKTNFYSVTIVTEQTTISICLDKVYHVNRHSRSTLAFAYRELSPLMVSVSDLTKDCMEDDSIWTHGHSMFIDKLESNAIDESSQIVKSSKNSIDKRVILVWCLSKNRSSSMEWCTDMKYQRHDIKQTFVRKYQFYREQ